MAIALGRLLSELCSLALFFLLLIKTLFHSVQTSGCEIYNSNNEIIENSLYPTHTLHFLLSYIQKNIIVAFASMGRN